MAERQFILFVTMSLWNEPHRGRHHFAARLSQRHRVLWMNRQLHWRESEASRTDIEPVNENLSVLHGGKSVVPARVEEWLNWNERRRLEQVKAVVDRLGMPTLVWIYDYRAIAIARYFREKCVTLYFCNDDFGDAAHRNYETHLAGTVDYVFATAPKLAARLRPHNPRAAFVPHGAPEPAVNGAFSKKPKPEAAGYVGTLRDITDIAFLRHVADESGLTLVLAGPVIECSPAQRQEFERLFTHPRVRYVGNQSHAAAARQIAELDVCLLPYRRTPESEYTFVIKFFEYLAAAKPIVATRYFEWPEPYAAFVREFDGKTSLAEFIRRVHAQWSEADHRAARALAARSSWESRIQEISRTIQVSL